MSKLSERGELSEQESVPLDELYQEIILDHVKHPRNKRALAPDEILVDEENPTCGDSIQLTVSVENRVIEQIAFDGHGCAISQASASMMSEALEGKTVDEAVALIEGFTAMVRGEELAILDALDEVAALEGVKKFPLRVKCATMSWHALGRALQVGATGGNGGV